MLYKYHLKIFEKISACAKFQSFGSKIEPATPFSILCVWRAWQPHFLSHTLQILVKHAFFIDVQMLLASYFCSSYQKVEIWENLILLSELRLQHVEKLHLVVYIAMKKSVFLKFLLFGKNYKNMILITFKHL